MNFRTSLVVFAELARRGWSDEDLGKPAGNILRVMRDVEAVDALSSPAAKLPARRSASWMG